MTARRLTLVALAALLALGLLAGPAAADHTEPDDVLTPTPEQGIPGTGGIERGEGTWEHLAAFPGHQGSDVGFFEAGGRIYANQGTLGQGQFGPASAHVGQRIYQLTDDDGSVAPRIRADHGSASCQENPDDAANLGLQHDSFATPLVNPEILVDTTDSLGRCHDPDGGGIELIDISGIADDAFEPREIHLIRFNGTTHTASGDPDRPWLVWSNNSTTQGGQNWLDVADIRSCLTTEVTNGQLPPTASLEDKRANCQPVVYRLAFEDVWTQGTGTIDGDPDGPSASCHDIVIETDIIYGACGPGDVYLDISGLTGEDGAVNGTPLPCTTDVAGTDTGALVTDCVLGGNPGGSAAAGAEARAAWEAEGSPQATGWELVGFFNHAGGDDPTLGQPTQNFNVPAGEGVAFAHETRPTPPAVAGGRQFTIVSDERGGGVLPGGATCESPGNFNEFGNGGLHFLDITDPDNIVYATEPDGSRAVWQGDVVLPSPTFCVVHRFRHLPDEQRIVVGYYSQGMKILDYTLDPDGNLIFDEVASLTLPDANTWTADIFKTVDNDDGTRTYYIAASDTLGSSLTRGLDVVSWTHTPNPIQRVDEDGRPILGTVVDRLHGPTRVETAVAISQDRFDAADTVVLARLDEYADALAGASLAHREGAPTLLTATQALPPATTEEIERLGAERVILLGGEVAISEAVAADLRERGLTVDRVGGANRFGTAALIAERLGDEHPSVLLVEGAHADPGRGWPDAVSAGPLAAFTERPVLLAVADQLPAETTAALEAAGATETVVIGGTVAINPSVVDELDERGHGPRRVSGANRYATSAAVVAEAEAAGMRPFTTYLATGQDWPDALTSGPAVAGDAGLLLLVDPVNIDFSPETRDALAARASDIARVVLLGGEKAISPLVAAQVVDIVDAEEDNTGRVSATEASAVTAGGGLPGGGLPGDVLLLLASLALVPIAALGGRRRRRNRREPTAGPGVPAPA